MNDCYSPHTFEHIATDNPAPWMGRAGVEPPEFDAATAGAFWRGNAWEIVVSEPAKLPPVSCSPWQIRKALNAQGLRQAVEDIVAASDDQGLIDGWEFATEFRSDDPFVISMGASIGKSEEETRQLIEYAASL